MAKSRRCHTKPVPIILASLMGQLAVHASVDVDSSGIFHSAHVDTVYENAFVCGSLVTRRSSIMFLTLT